MSEAEKPFILFKTDKHELRLEGELQGFKTEFKAVQVEKNLELVTLTLIADKAAVPPLLRLLWSKPVVDMQVRWTPELLFNYTVVVDFWDPMRSRVQANAPVVSFSNTRGINRLTFAFSDAVSAIDVQAGISERTAEASCSLNLFRTANTPLSRYSATLLLDTREIPFYRSLHDVRKWWKSSYVPCAVPAAGRMPFYSSWYSFHEKLSSQRIIEQCQLAKDLGMDTIIVDDGWQNRQKGIIDAAQDDWAPLGLPEIRETVERVHALGMKFMLWYSVPFISKSSRERLHFEDKLLEEETKHGGGVLDPRFPQVREYLISTWEKAVREWNLDGLKLDFIDSFRGKEEKSKESGKGRDLDSVEQAVVRLLEDMNVCLKKIKPDLLIEFRQAYIGPVMRQFGNLFRAADCANNSVVNRCRVVDLRLLSGSTAVHGDMLMWHPAETPEAAALQILNVLFGVPQVSMDLKLIPQSHRDMIRFWLRFCREQADLLQEGEMRPQHPDQNYPVVVCTTGHKRVLAVYTDAAADPGAEIPETLFIVNATLRSRVVLELGEDLNGRRAQTFDCLGNKTSDEQVTLARGLYSLNIPPAGLMVVKKS